MASVSGAGAKKLREPRACFCVLCSQKLVYATSGKKVPVLRRKHKAAIRALQQTSPLQGATATSEVAAPIIDRTWVLKIRIFSFIAEHDLSFTIAQPLVELCKRVASDKTAWP